MKEQSQKKLWDFYNHIGDVPIYKKEFGFYVLDRWISEGYLKSREQVDDYNAYLRDLFGYDMPASYTLYGLGGTTAAFIPAFEEKLLEDRGVHELVQDHAGRSVLYFKGRRQGFMPEYVDHPVKDRKTWENHVKWRLLPNNENRLEMARTAGSAAKKAQLSGDVISQVVIGAYMYLRSLMGPVDLLYKFYDEPDLIHSCMQTWLQLAETVITEHQKQVSLDEILFDEDICYNGGSLISPDMVREFLFPYYQQLITTVTRQNNHRKLHIQIATDGRSYDVIDLYREIGMDFMSPFEVASGCDVVKIAEKYPDLLLSGGIDKRLIASGGDAIKRHLDYIMPKLRKRGGYIPTCDHGVPEETSFENYMLYRSLIEEYCN